MSQPQKPTMPDPSDLDSNDYGERDAASIKILGFFFTILGLLVLLGTLGALDNTRAAIVNAVSGLVLALIGAAMLLLVKHRSNPKG
jgi:hypothetical protein